MASNAIFSGPVEECEFSGYAFTVQKQIEH